MAYYEGRINSGGLMAGYQKIRELLELQGWVKIWESKDNRTGKTWLYYQGPAVVGGEKSPLLAFSTSRTTSSSVYNLIVLPLIELDRNVTDPTAQPFCGFPVAIQFPNDETPYDFRIACNGRRITGVFNFATRGFPFYLGFYVPYGTPEEFPYPMFCGGSTSTRPSDFATYAYTSTNYTSANRPFLRPFTDNYNNIDNPQRAWVANSTLYAGAEWLIGSATENARAFSIWQTNHELIARTGETKMNFTDVAPSGNGVYPLTQLEIVLPSDNPLYMSDGPQRLFAGGMLGVLEGLYFPFGRELTTDATCVVDGVGYVIGQQHTQVTEASFFAIEKV